MTASAWIMLGATWTVIVVFVGRFFWKVLTTPVGADRIEQTQDGILEKDA